MENEDNWKEAGLGDLPPYTHLEVSDSVQGILAKVRQSEQPEGKGKKKIVKIKINLELKLTKETTLSRGPVKSVKRVDLEEGDRIAFSVGGNMSWLLCDAVEKLTGEALGEDDELTADYLKPLEGKEFKIERKEDSVIKSGQWRGRPAKRYVLKWR